MIQRKKITLKLKDKKIYWKGILTQTNSESISPVTGAIKKAK
jgi:hypothetical protein